MPGKISNREKHLFRINSLDLIFLYRRERWYVVDIVSILQLYSFWWTHHTLTFILHHLHCISLKIKPTLKCLPLNLCLLDLPSPRDCFFCKLAGQHHERIHISSEMSCLLSKLTFSAVGTSAIILALYIKTGHLVSPSNYLSCNCAPILRLCTDPASCLWAIRGSGLKQ